MHPLANTPLKGVFAFDMFLSYTVVMDTHIQTLEKNIADILKFFKEDVSSIRGARPTSALVEDISVEYYGQKMPLKQLGSISIVPPREIQISVWDGAAASAVAKAVSAKLSIMAAQEGNVVHANLPSLTQGRRDEFIKIVKAKAEDARIKSRAARDEIKKEMTALEKTGDMTKDDLFASQEKMQKIMDGFNAEVDGLVEKKTAEINE